MEKFEIVETEHGRVRGVHKLSALATDYVSFQGIPYIRAPLGSLRFREPQPPEPWTHVLDASEDSPSYCALNMLTREKQGEENAGTISVFTKNVQPEKPYPVMVWIHGGAFMRGSCITEIYGPDYLLERDVILVSFNYRLGAIGFLSLESEELNVPGNTGLKDQVFALRWIKKNIRGFGGDPDNVTLFGESAGGGSVHFLSIAELARGLFNRAIVMSGTAFCKQWSIIPRAFCRRLADKLARKLGWGGKAGDERDLLAFLENAPACDIVDETNTLLSNEDEFAEGLLIPFGPVIEPYKSPHCLIRKDPVEMAREAWSNDIDILFTGASFEGIWRANNKEEVAFYYLQNPAYFAPLLDLDLQVTDPIAREYGQRIRDVYYEAEKRPSVENRECYLRYSSDFAFWHGIYRALLSRIEFARGKTFLFRFNVDGELNLFKRLRKCETLKGASHGDDLFYLFKTSHLSVPERDSGEFQTIERMTGIFANFATVGDPNCIEISPGLFSPVTSADELRCVEITVDDVVEIELPELSALRVWCSVYADHDVPLF